MFIVSVRGTCNMNLGINLLYFFLFYFILFHFLSCDITRNGLQIE